MAKVLSGIAKEYMEKLTNQNTNISETLYRTALKLREMDEEAFTHCAYLVYSYQCPVDVAFLAFDLCCKQLNAGRNANPQRIFQPLSKSNRSSYEMVKPLYDNAIIVLEKKMEEKKKQEEELKKEDIIFNANIKINNEKNIKIIKEEDGLREDISFAQNFLTEKNFLSDKDDCYVVNTCCVPKCAWAFKVYAESYDDYCHIVQSTVKELNDKGITVFLTKPEILKNNKNLSSKKPEIAYMVLVNEKFKFSLLSESFIKEVDGNINIDNGDGVKISARGYIDYISFVGNYYINKNGDIVENKQEVFQSFANEDEILQTIENLGDSDNIIQYYINIKTGIVQNNKNYITILCKKEDTIQIASILKRMLYGNLDFLIDSDQETIQILFAHKAHVDELLKEMKNNGIIYDLNFKINN